MKPEKIRGDFSILEKDIVYLDSACAALKPKQVVSAINNYYNEFPACAGRSMHALGDKLSKKIDSARKTIAKFFNAKQNEIIFTRNTTEAINLVANSFKFKKGAAVLTSDKEHNSNLLPWIKLQEKGIIKHLVIPSNPDNTFNFDEYEKLLKTEKPKLVSIVHTSNLDGVTFPIVEIIKLAHKYNSLVLVDAAQSAGHIEIDVKKLDVDFMACSGHKMLGPSGMGLLYGKQSLLEKLDTFILGGGTVKNSLYDKYELEKIPERFEAGLQNYAGIIGFAEAVNYISKIGVKTIGAHCIKLNKMLTSELKDKPIKIIGPQDAESRGSIFTFYSEKINPHEIQLLLNANNIYVRSGAFCVHSWFNSRNVNGAVRISLHIYNTEDEIKKLVDWLNQILKI